MNSTKIKGTWRHSGGWLGGTVYCVAVSPQPTGEPVVLAATGAGLFRSFDRGHTWQRVDGSLRYAAVLTLAWASDGRIAWAGTTDGRLFVSRDAGAAWQRCDAWAYGVANSIAVSPAFDRDALLFVATSDGIVRSTDGGDTWQSANFGLLDVDMLCVACVPGQGDGSMTVWAGSAEGGLYRSPNAGRAWRESGEGLADTTVQCLVAAGSTVWAGTDGKGVYRSRDGRSWTQCGPPDAQVNGLAAGDNVIIAGTGDGLWTSPDGGETWVYVETSESASVLSVAIAGEAVIAGCLGLGVLTSTDRGDIWQPSNTGLTAHAPPLVGQSFDGTLFCADAVGQAAWSPDGGQTWEPCAFAPNAGEGNDHSNTRVVQSISPAGASHPSAVIAATREHVSMWDTVKRAFAPVTMQPSIRSTEDSINVVRVTREGVMLMGTHGGALAVSADGGRAWHMTTLPGTGPIVEVVLGAMGVLYGLRIAPNTNDATQARYSAEVWCLPALVLPFAGGDESDADDGGWQMIAALDALTVPHACLCLAGSGDEAQVILGGGNVIAMLPAATNLLGADAVSHTYLPTEARVTQLLARRDQLLATTSVGVFVSLDGGVTWQPEPALTGLPIVALLGSSSRLRAVTLGGEVWTEGGG